MYLVNPSGRITSVEREDLIQSLLKSGAFREATDKEISDFRAKQIESSLKSDYKEEIPIEKPTSDVYLATVATSPDGYGQSSKILLDSLQKAGLNISLKHQNQNVGLLYSYPYRLETMKTPIKLIYTMFESTKIPADWVKPLKLADKVFVPSKFCQEAFKSREIESEVIPLGYDDESFTYQAKPLDTSGTFTFLHYNAFNTRKGWDIVFNAFTEEFKDTENVKLIMKTVKKELPFPILKSQYPNIEVIKEDYNKKKLCELLQQSDCFVFPSRGEGFGLPPLEALATGTPVIIPNGSGMAEYFNPDYFYEVKIEKMMPAMYQKFTSTDTGEMIEPSETDLRKQMRYVFEHRELAYRKARVGATWVKENYSMKLSSNKLKLAIEPFINLKVEVATTSKQIVGNILKIEEI
jgi:hypothetical protein